MKHEVIPAILAQNKSEFFGKLDAAARFAKTVQIDVMDGVFVDNKTPRELNNGNWFSQYLLTHQGGKVPDIELHLMVMDPWRIIQDWKRFGQLKRVIWHVEVPIIHGDLIQIVHDLRLKAGLAINPKTSVDELKPDLSKTKSKATVDHILVMGVTPGRSGQRFKPSVLTKIKALRRKYPKLSIGVDGGVNLKNAPSMKHAGAIVLNAAGAIFLADNHKIAYAELVECV